MYKNLQINEQITVQDEILNGCFIVVDSVSIDNVIDLKANYMLSIYKSKQVYETNIDWKIYPNEISNGFQKSFESTFLDGDIFEKIAEEIKIFLQQKNNWTNIVIE